MTEPIDPRHEDALSRALHAQAETVRPAGDGLVRIRGRVDRRRRRVLWVAPVGALVGTAAAVTAVVATGVLHRAGNTPAPGLALPRVSLSSLSLPATTAAPVRTTPPPAVLATSVPATAAPTSARTTTGAPTPSALVAAETTPVQGPVPVWPFADAQDAAGWQRGQAKKYNLPWQLQADATALQFVKALGLPVHQVSVTADTADGHPSGAVTLASPGAESGRPVPFATVDLAHWGTGPAAPWGVTSVSAKGATVTSPVAGSTVGSTLPVSYALPGATEAELSVQAWQVGGTAALATPTATGGVAGTVTLEPDIAGDGPGFVVLADVSGDGLHRLVVSPVRLHDTAALAAGDYVTVANGALALASSGAVLVPNGVTEAQVSDDRQWVYYLQGTGACDTTLRRIALSAGAVPVTVATTGGSVDAFSVAGPHGEQLAYAAQDCATGEQAVHWHTGNGTSGTITGFGSQPPSSVTALALSPDGARLATVTGSGVELYPLAAATSSADAEHLQGCASGCVAAAYAPDGDLVYVSADGAQLTVHRSHDGAAATSFSVPATGLLATVDVNAQGTGVLLTDGASHAWRWVTGGRPTPVAGVSDASW